MPRFATPAWRIAGAIVAWLVFAFSVSAMFIAAASLTRIGGFCASGGPFVIETECPDVVNGLPFGFFGIFIAVVIAYLFQGGFAAPVPIWGWPILFVGLGIQFFALIPVGGVVVGIVLGLFFFAMGLAPLIFEVRNGGLRRLVLGRTNARDQLFVDRSRRSLYSYGNVVPGEPVAPTPGDWLLSLAVSLLPLAAGALLAVLLLAPALLAPASLPGGSP